MKDSFFEASKEPPHMLILGKFGTALLSLNSAIEHCLSGWSDSSLSVIQGLLWKHSGECWNLPCSCCKIRFRSIVLWAQPFSFGENHRRRPALTWAHSRRCFFCINGKCQSCSMLELAIHADFAGAFSWNGVFQCTQLHSGTTAVLKKFVWYVTTVTQSTSFTLPTPHRSLAHRGLSVVCTYWICAWPVFGTRAHRTQGVTRKVVRLLKISRCERSPWEYLSLENHPADRHVKARSLSVLSVQKRACAKS